MDITLGDSSYGAITPVQYEPPAGYSLDLEIYRDPELRRRARDIRGRLERIDFHVLIWVAAGRYDHMVDFEQFDCRKGSMLLLRPGQIHRFGEIARFRGWLLIFRADLLPANPSAADFTLASRLESLPTHVAVGRRARAAIDEQLARMADDASRPADAMLAVLLHDQLRAILARICLETADLPSTAADRVVVERFRRFRAAVEHEHHRWHTVKQYARHLGCSEKSLTRAARAVTGITAKAFVTERITLEAKRLLAHTTAPVAEIADRLGFDEPTNFVKFFRTSTGTTPGAFRRNQSMT